MVDLLAGDPRPTLFDLWKVYRFQIESVCLFMHPKCDQTEDERTKKLHLCYENLLAMLRYKPVPQRDAEEILTGLSEYLSQCAQLRQESSTHIYTLENVRVKLIEGDGGNATNKTE